MANKKNTNGSGKQENQNQGKRRSTKGQKRGPLVSFKDVVMGYNLEGMNYVRKLDEQGHLSKANLSGAVKYFREHDRDYPELENYLNERFPSGDGDRGRPAPKAGESRRYRVQQLYKDRKVEKEKSKDKEGKEITVRRVVEPGTPLGPPFIRLPIEALGLGSDDEVLAEFGEDNSVVIRPAPPK